MYSGIAINRLRYHSQQIQGRIEFRNDSQIDDNKTEQLFVIKAVYGGLNQDLDVLALLALDQNESANNEIYWSQIWSIY